MTSSTICPVCGDSIPQFGGPADGDIRFSHHLAKHPRANPDGATPPTLADGVVLLAALILLVVVLGSLFQ